MTEICRQHILIRVSAYGRLLLSPVCRRNVTKRLECEGLRERQVACPACTALHLCCVPICDSVWAAYESVAAILHMQNNVASCYK